MTIITRRVVGVTTVLSLLVGAYLIALGVDDARATWGCPVSAYDHAVRDGDPQQGVRTISDGTVTVTVTYTKDNTGALAISSWTSDGDIGATYVRGRGGFYELAGGTYGGGFMTPDGSTISHVAWCYNTGDGSPPTTTEPPDDTTTTTFGTTTTTDGGTTTTTAPDPTTTTTAPEPTTTSTTAPEPTTTTTVVESTTTTTPAPTTSTTVAPTTTTTSPPPPTTTTTRPATTTTTAPPDSTTTTAPDDGPAPSDDPAPEDTTPANEELGSTPPDAPTFETGGSEDDDSDAPGAIAAGGSDDSSDDAAADDTATPVVPVPAPVVPDAPLLAVDWFSRMTTDQRVLVGVGFGLGAVLSAMGIVKGYRSREDH